MDASTDLGESTSNHPFPEHVCSYTVGLIWDTNALLCNLRRQYTGSRSGKTQEHRWHRLWLITKKACARSVSFARSLAKLTESFAFFCYWLDSDLRVTENGKMSQSASNDFLILRSDHQNVVIGQHTGGSLARKQKQVSDFFTNRWMRSRNYGNMEI